MPLSDDSIPRFRVLPGPDHGFQVVERTSDGYDLPRGWTYSSKEFAAAALPLVEAGNLWPSREEVQARAVGVEPEGEP